MHSGGLRHFLVNHHFVNPLVLRLRAAFSGCRIPPPLDRALRHSPGALLNRVSQFMREQPLPLAGVRCVLPGAEADALSQCESPRLN